MVYRSLALFFALCSTALADDAASVLALSDPARWEFIGNETYSARELRRALGCDLDVLAASRSPAPDALIRALRLAVERGHLHMGFAEVEVSAALAPRRMRVPPPTYLRRSCMKKCCPHTPCSSPMPDLII